MIFSPSTTHNRSCSQYHTTWLPRPGASCKVHPECWHPFQWNAIFFYLLSFLFFFFFFFPFSLLSHWTNKESLRARVATWLKRSSFCLISLYFSSCNKGILCTFKKKIVPLISWRVPRTALLELWMRTKDYIIWSIIATWNEILKTCFYIYIFFSMNNNRWRFHAFKYFPLYVNRSANFHGLWLKGDVMLYFSSG